MKMMKKKSILLFFIVLSVFLRFILLAQEKAEIQDDNDMIYYLFAVAVLLVIVIVTLVVMISSGNKDITPFNTIDNDLTIRPSLKLSNRELGILETPTIKMAAPPTGTLKLLPGHLEVVDGDDSLKEIRFRKMQNKEAEITFGRKSSTSKTHVQLKPMTVSLDQAKLIYTNGKYLLINYTDVNPTIVNDEPLSKDGSIYLEEGDKIKMGEVSFIFHEK